jgi:curli production assembly/transport component CsgG/holdfast attachment protein HfaB
MGVISGCGAGTMAPMNEGIQPAFSYPVTSNNTPYSQCLSDLRKFKAKNLPVFAVGEVSDKTGQFNYDVNGKGNALSQGVSEMVISALAKTGKANMVERLDLRIPLAEVKLAEQNRLNRDIKEYGKLPASDFVLIGALTELNYNIVSGGSQLFIRGIGGGGRTVVINVALDLRVVDSRNFSIRYVSSLQKQIYGYEIEANIFRFFGNNLVEFDAGAVRNEPLQLGVRSVVEMTVYQIMTDFLKLPEAKGCGLVETEHMSSYLKNISPDEKPSTLTSTSTPIKGKRQ